jgi:hypothetical protein
MDLIDPGGFRSNCKETCLTVSGIPTIRFIDWLGRHYFIAEGSHLIKGVPTVCPTSHFLAIDEIMFSGILKVLKKNRYWFILFSSF